MLYFLGYILIGILAGTASGLLGIGGGVIIIPGLVWLFKAQGISYHLIMHMAAGTALASMILTASSSAYGHIKRGANVWPTYKRLAPGIIIGTIIGAIIGHFIPNRALEIIFGIFIIFFAVRMILNFQSKPSRKLPNNFFTFLIAFIIGAKSGILGIGGGAIIIPVLTYCNVKIRDTVAISATCSVTIAIIGAISFMLMGQYATHLPNLSIGYVYLPALLGIILVAPLCAQIGAYFSHRLPVDTLKRILGFVLLIIAVRMLS